MKKLLLTLTLAFSLLSVSCAKEQTATNNNQSEQVEPINPVDPVIPEGDGELSSGGVANLEVTTSRFEEFLTRPTNRISDVKIKLDLTKNNDDTFSGKATVYFTDNGQTYFVEFYSGGQEHSQYNKWINDGRHFHAVFDDFELGMLVVTIDRVYDLGDGLGHEESVDGSVFFYNYDLGGYLGVPTAPHPQRMFPRVDSYCWEIRRGPYSCKPYSSLSAANTQVWPDDHLRLLGRFTGLNVNNALNLED